MKHCSHCGLYEPHDSRGWWCRRCICASIGNHERFERLRRPSFLWLRLALEVSANILRFALGRDLRT